MIEDSDLELRHALPRWLSISKAIETGLFARAGKVKPAADKEKLRAAHRTSLLSEFERQKREWKKSGEESDAEELISVAVVAGREADDTVVAAATVVGALDGGGPAMKALAQAILSGDIRRPDRRNSINAANLHNEIRVRKNQLKLNPRDALLMTEMALCHTNLGQAAASEKLLRRALALSPNSRFILRSAARFLCHHERADEALRLLRRTPRVDSDPWLKSAELAVAGLTGDTIRGWRRSRSLANDASLAPRDRSELATELATLEFAAGARKAGLRQVRSAVTDPTENAAAQVEFLASKTEDFILEDYLPDLSSAMEAQAYHAYRKGQLRTAFEACEAWHELEPFSIRPAIFGSFLSTARPNSLDRGIALATAGLSSNPGNAALMNNLAVLLAYKGDVDAAQRYSARARSSIDSQNDIANIATSGLIFFRRGEVDQGVDAYERAISQAAAGHNVEMAVRAYAFFAREMSRIDPSMNRSFRAEFERIDSKLSRVGKRLPRDVALIATEFADDDAANRELLLNFTSFSDRYLDDLLI